MDIWLSDQSLIPIIRKAVTGYTSLIGGICSNDTKYSIIELSGFQGVLWAAHELGNLTKRIFKFISYFGLTTTLYRTQVFSLSFYLPSRPFIITTKF